MEELYRLTGRRPHPCTFKEVAALEHWCGHRFPEAYREFLLWMGHDGGGVLQGSDCFYRDLQALPSHVEALLEEERFAGKLPENIFVFFMHQGYQFNFFHFDDGEDLPVYWYMEDRPTSTSFARIYAHFSDFLLTEVADHIAYCLRH